MPSSQRSRQDFATSTPRNGTATKPKWVSRCESCSRGERCKSEGIVLLAFASLGHALEPRLLDDPLVVSLAQRFGKTPAQALLAWGIQRGSAVLTASVTPARIRENFDVTALPDSAIQEI